MWLHQQTSLSFNVSTWMASSFYRSSSRSPFKSYYTRITSSADSIVVAFNRSMLGLGVSGYICLEMYNSIVIWNRSFFLKLYTFRATLPPHLFCTSITCKLYLLFRDCLVAEECQYFFGCLCPAYFLGI